MWKQSSFIDECWPLLPASPSLRQLISCGKVRGSRDSGHREETEEHPRTSRRIEKKLEFIAIPSVTALRGSLWENPQDFNQAITSATLGQGLTEKHLPHFLKLILVVMDEKSPPLSPTLPGEVSALFLATFPFRRLSILLFAYQWPVHSGTGGTLVEKKFHFTAGLTLPNHRKLCCLWKKKKSFLVLVLHLRWDEAVFFKSWPLGKCLF